MGRKYNISSNKQIGEESMQRYTDNLLKAYIKQNDAMWQIFLKPENSKYLRKISDEYTQLKNDTDKKIKEQDYKIADYEIKIKNFKEQLTVMSREQEEYKKLKEDYDNLRTNYKICRVLFIILFLAALTWAKFEDSSKNKDIDPISSTFIFMFSCVISYIAIIFIPNLFF